MGNRRIHKIRYKPNSTAMRYMAAAFVVLALALVAISAYSFIAARELQENYNKMVCDSLRKLELINSLHNREDFIYNITSKHLQSVNRADMTEMEEQIAEANREINSQLQELKKLIKQSDRQKVLQNYTAMREDYAAILRRLLLYSTQHEEDLTSTPEAQQLLPLHHQQLSYLNQLSDSISVTTQELSSGALREIDNGIRKYNLLLLASFFVAGVAAYLIRHVVRQMRQQNVMLESEIREKWQLKSAYNESQLIYKSLFQNIAIPMWVFDEHTLDILEVNDAAIKEYGYTREEFLTLNVADLQPEKQKAKLEQVLDFELEVIQTYPDWQHKRKDGSQFYVDVKSHRLPVQGAMWPRVVVSINIDERVRATQELERREKQLYEISSSIPGAVYQFQMEKDGSFAFSFVSEGVTKLFQVKPEAIIGDPNVFFSIVHPKDSQAVWDSILRSYQSMQPWEYEFRGWQELHHKYIWLKGSSLPTRKENGTITWNGTLIDISAEKEAQEKLLASEANLRYLLNSSPQAIYLLDANLDVVAYNARAAEEVKSTQLKALRAGESIVSFIAPSQLENTLTCHKKALNGETTVFETNSSGIWHEIAFRPVLGPEQQVLAVALSIEDITEQKAIIETLQQNETQLNRAQELSHMGYWEHNLVTGRVTWSENLYRIYGLSPATFTPQAASINNMVHPDDATLIAESYDHATETGKPVQIEHRILTPKGEERNVIHIAEAYFDEYRRPVRMSGTIQDITERKRAEREITETKNLLQSTLENIPEIIFSTDAAFRITYISSQCYEILGYTVQELTGNTDLWTKNIFPEDLPKAVQVMDRLRSGERFQYEIRIVRRDGKTRWLMLRLSPTLDEEGNMFRLDGSASDITQHKLAEAKREELNEQLITQNRNLQQFAYIVSHNLRAPIANILGLTSIYDRKNPEAPINQRVIENMFKSAKLLDSTIRDLNQLLAIRSDKLNGLLEQVSFDEVLQHVTDSLADEIQVTGAEITSDFSEAPAVVTIRSYLQSILHNLVSNAVKYRDTSRILNVNLRTFVVDDYICLQVSDNGLGIDVVKERDKLFGLYKRFHPQIAGKGLGLHLVKTQAELLGGKVDVESSVGVGTTFSVYFVRSSIIHEHFKESNVD
ncbi:MAG TPA: PAS domain S-box protein [Pontibacter sp.]